MTYSLTSIDLDYQPDYPLQLANRARVPFFLETLQRELQSKSLEGKRILDIGCGGGLVTEAIAKNSRSQVIGMSKDNGDDQN